MRIGRPARDDAERFSGLYRDTNRELFAFLLRRCASTDAAADCLAETYRIAWEKRRSAPTDNEIRPWLFGVARNVSRRERANEERAAATSHALALAAEQAHAATNAEDSAATAALSQLSPLDQEILTMLTWDGLAPREVASVLGLSPNAVRVRAYKARTRLRVALAPNAACAPERPTRPSTASSTGSPAGC